MSPTATAVASVGGRAAEPAAFPPPPPPPPPLLLLLPPALGEAPLPPPALGEAPLLPPSDGVALCEPLSLGRGADGVGVGVALGERDVEGGSGGHSEGGSSWENSQPPARQRAPDAGPEICPLAQRCVPAAVLHQPHEVGSTPGLARPEMRQSEQVVKGGHLSAGSPAQYS